MTQQPTPFKELNQVLNAFVQRLGKILGNSLIGVYLQGSFALGDFDQHSDVDFIVAIKDELLEDQVDALQEMHDKVYRLESEWAKHLEGSYFPRNILESYRNEGTDLWYLDHGASSLVRSDHCNTALVRWVVREKGVVLAGATPTSLIMPIPTEILRSEMHETLISWGNEILEDPSRFKNHFYQAFIVLSYCRMLHDIYRGYPGSKLEGAEWAKSVLDPSWHDLIDQAWEGRPDPASKVRETADPQAFGRTLQLVELVMRLSYDYM